MENKKRKSNLELMRIIMMIVIIIHHYVVNSGITELYDFSEITPNMIFLQCMGFAGKAMINCFILITGYFMIKKKITLKKIVKLYLEMKFYQIVIFVILSLLGIEEFGLKRLIKALFSVIYNVNIYFSETFFIMYLLIPFINILIYKLNKEKFSTLLCILLFYFTIISTFSITHDTFNEITWYIVVYMIGAYIRLYPNRYDRNKQFWLIASILCILCCIGSILSIDLINNKLNTTFNAYFFIANAHKLLAVITSICLFMLFRNIDIKYNKFINDIASTTFGVLLIHANSDAMRKFIWQILFNVKEQYYSQYLYIHLILTVCITYVVCVCIDLLRIKFIEKPFFKCLENNETFIKISSNIDKVYMEENHE